MCVWEPCRTYICVGERGRIPLAKFILRRPRRNIKSQAEASSGPASGLTGFPDVTDRELTRAPSYPAACDVSTNPARSVTWAKRDVERVRGEEKKKPFAHIEA